MSEQMVSQKMKRVCDACGKEQEWELVNVTEQALEEMQSWYLIVRKVFVNGRPGAIDANACSLPCVPAAAVKLALPEQSQSGDDIDLAQLRATNFNPAN
jgi:hypothetical protein